VESAVDDVGKGNRTIEDNYTQSSYEWAYHDGPLQNEILLDFNVDGAFSFHYGFRNPEPPDRLARFDATERVIDFLRMFRLSDGPPTPPRNADGLTENEASFLDDFVGDLKGLTDEVPEPAVDEPTLPSFTGFTDESFENDEGLQSDQHSQGFKLESTPDSKSRIVGDKDEL